jgi:hypothetical protein
MRLTNLEQCSLLLRHDIGTEVSFTSLPCAALRHLHLEGGLDVQLAATDGHPGILHDCTGLTSLHLEVPAIIDYDEDFDAILELEQLQCLKLILVPGAVPGVFNRLF